MLAIGPAQKITIYLNDDVSSKTTFLHEQVLQFLLERGVAGATLLRVQAGFGAHHHLHTAGAAGVGGEHLSVRIEFIESEETVKALLPALSELVTDGLIESQSTTILKVAVGNAERL
jgi:PII-like signaling protein